MNVKGNPTRARARIGAYELSQRDSELRKLARQLDESDLDHFVRAARKLTPAGHELLASIIRMTISRDLASGAIQVRPFTRAQLGNYLTAGAKLCPHDVKLLNDMVKASIIQVDREPLEAKRFVGAAGDELMKGAGWQYTYILSRIAALALLRENPKRRAEIEAMLKDDELPSFAPLADSKPKWWRW